MTPHVGIVIVSHSPKVAEGAADMVRQMVGDEVRLAWTGGNPSGAATVNSIVRDWACSAKRAASPATSRARSVGWRWRASCPASAWASSRRSLISRLRTTVSS